MDTTEVKLIKEAETAKSQWKLPSVFSISQGVFLVITTLGCGNHQRSKGN
jgi:hypothetical protein